MRYGSVCSGIEAATSAWHSLGWVPSFFSEIEEFPRRVLEHHYPDVPLHGDFTTIGADDYGSIDLLVGGTPCQSFSVAGLRGGMDDERGNLALEYLKLAQRKRPRWLVWENVPGVLSSNGGRDFGAFLGGLVELGYGFAYRVLDAQYFGVAQRRRRVFVVGYLGDWRPAAAVLFERQSLQGHSAPSRETGERVAPAVTTGPPFSRTGNERVECEAIVPVTGPLTAGMGKGPRGTEGIESNHVIPTVRLDLPEHDVCGTLSDGAHMGGGLNGQDAYSGRVMAVGFQSTANACDAAGAGENVSRSLRAADPMAVAFAQNTRDEVREMPYSGALAAHPGMKQTTYLRQGLSVRRLTPRECERLQGFPDDYTMISYRNKPAENCPDGPRYKALGNSMAVPVMRWIGKRIQQVEEMMGD
jgi:DNA (cytosine-5)-methyltransferase 1